LIAGLVVIGLGLWLLFLQLDVVRIDPPWEWWPLILVALGLGKLLGAGSHRELTGGVWLMVLGGWLIVNFQGWFGLYWDNSWPLLMVAAGALIVWRAVADPGGTGGCRGRRRPVPPPAVPAAPGEEA
jgi:hypothetical protein